MADKSQATLLIWQAITPVHAGTGQASAAVVDLPIAREVATNFPMLPASSIKGVFRSGDGLRKDEQDTITKQDEQYGYVNKKTGKKDEQGNDIRGSQAAKLTFTDARLLCLPVRSYRGTFAYVTCPLVVQRLKRDMTALGLSHALPDLPDDLKQAHVTGDTLQHGGKVLFEDIDLDALECPNAKALAETLARFAGLDDGFKQRLAVVPNDVFTYFSETATEVSAHIALEQDTKTVKDGALWYEEALPAETLLSSFVLKNGEDFAVRSPLQIGGKGSVGKGLLSVREAAHG